MRVRAGKRTIGLGLGLVVALAVGAWTAGREIRSSAQVAAETAPPVPSAITAPVELRVLSSEVIVRGTVRYGSPQPVVLASSEAKQASGDAEIVTTRPRPGTGVDEGSAVMSVSGRPVFVLRGAQPSHRDLGPGTRGPDVRQLESALARMGFAPGAVDGRYDGADRRCGRGVLREPGLGAVRPDRPSGGVAASRERRRGRGARPVPAELDRRQGRSARRPTGRDRAGPPRRRGGPGGRGQRGAEAQNGADPARGGAAGRAREHSRDAGPPQPAARQRAGDSRTGPGPGDAEQGVRRTGAGTGRLRRGATRQRTLGALRARGRRARGD